MPLYPLILLRSLLANCNESFRIFHKMHRQEKRSSAEMEKEELQEVCVSLQYPLTLLLNPEHPDPLYFSSRMFRIQKKSQRILQGHANLLKLFLFHLSRGS